MKWKQGIDRADSNWDGWDSTIKLMVFEYNRHLRDSRAYRDLDWRWIKVMLWTESGPFNPAWKQQPMQIGVLTDQGLGGLLNGREGGDLIIPSTLRFNSNTARATPRDNIAAGVGYLLMRMADFGFETQLDKDGVIFEVTVQRGDKGLSDVARRCASTADLLAKLNPGARFIHVGDVLKCRKASVQKIIVGWKPFTSTMIAKRYNAKDPKYAEKLEYALAAIKRRQP